MIKENTEEIENNFNIHKSTKEEFSQVGIFEWKSSNGEKENDENYRKFLEENSLKASKLNEAVYYFSKSENGIYQGGGGYFTSYDFIKGEYAELQAFYVEKEFRRQGIMKKIYEKIEEDLMSSGMKRLQLNCYDQNTPAINFYKKFGIEKKFKTFGYPGIDYSNMPKNFEEYESQRKSQFKIFSEKNQEIFLNKFGLQIVNSTCPSCQKIPQKVDLLNFTNLLDYLKICVEENFSKLENFKKIHEKTLGKSVETYWIFDPDGFVLGFFSVNYIPHFYFGVEQAHCRHVFVNNEVIQLKDEILEFVIASLVKIVVEEKGGSCVDFEVKEEEYDEEVDQVFKNVGFFEGCYPVFGKEFCFDGF